MQTTVLLGGNLRKEAVAGNQERTLDPASDATVSDLVRLLGLPSERIGMILVNGRGATLSTELHDGDRVGLFPPELRYNTFVSLYFRPEAVQARKAEPED